MIDDPWMTALERCIYDWQPPIVSEWEPNAHRIDPKPVHRIKCRACHYIEEYAGPTDDVLCAVCLSNGVKE